MYLINAKPPLEHTHTCSYPCVQEGVAALTVYLINAKAPLEHGEEYLYSYEEPGETRWVVWSEQEECGG